jgi:hypothetical protein
VRHRKDLGSRRHARVGYRRQGFIIPAPDAPWLECFIPDVSDSGICIEVGVPKVFGVSFNRDGTVVRVCFIAWRRGELIGARYITAKQLRQQERIYVDPRLQNAKLDTAASSPNN